MTSAIVLPEGKQSFQTATGAPLAGGRLYTYAAGTNTPKPTWADADKVSANPNPIILDARGEATIFWDGAYKVELRDASDVLIWTVDKVETGDTTLRSDLAAPSGASLVGYRYNASAVTRTVESRLREVAYASDFGAVGNGVVDDRPALQAALDSVAGGARVLRLQPAKTYRIVGRLRIPQGVSLDMQGSTLFFATNTGGVDANSNSWLLNGTLSAAGVSGYAGPMYVVDDTDGYDRIVNQTMGLYYVSFIGPGQGPAASGTAIRIRGGGGNGVAAIFVTGGVVYNFSTAVHLHGQASWVNNCRFLQQEMFGCRKFYHLQTTGAPGREVDGNVFIGYTIQPNTDVAIGEHGILCDGSFNRFYGNTWDWDVAGSPTGIEFSTTARFNIVEEIIPIEFVRFASLDMERGNWVRSMTGSFSQTMVGYLPPPTTEAPNFTHVDDFLAYADRRATVTLTGDPITSGSLGNIFRMNGLVAGWSALSSATITIDLGFVATYLSGAGVMFGFDQVAANVTLQWSLDGSSWTNIISLTGNKNYIVERVGKSFLAGTFRYVRVTLGNSTPAPCSLQRFFAFSPALRGNLYLPAEGGRAIGGFTLDQQATAPPAPTNGITLFVNNSGVLQGRRADGTIFTVNVT